MFAEILENVVDLWDSDSTLSSIPLSFSEAKPQAYPYAVFSLSAGAGQELFSGTRRLINLRFNVYTDESSIRFADELMERINEVFHLTYIVSSSHASTSKCKIQGTSIAKTFTGKWAGRQDFSFYYNT